jgi:leucyl-tRNA synthetase
VDDLALVTDEISLVVQVSGKKRGTVMVAITATREEIEASALAEPNVARFLAGQTVLQVIVVPGRLVNVVIG